MFGTNSGQNHGQHTAQRVAQERDQKHGHAVDAGGLDRCAMVVSQSLGQPVVKQAASNDGERETESAESSRLCQQVKVQSNNPKGKAGWISVPVCS